MKVVVPAFGLNKNVIHQPAHVQDVTQPHSFRNGASSLICFHIPAWIMTLNHEPLLPLNSDFKTLGKFMIVKADPVFFDQSTIIYTITL